MNFSFQELLIFTLFFGLVAAIFAQINSQLPPIWRVIFGAIALTLIGAVVIISYDTLPTF